MSDEINQARKEVAQEILKDILSRIKQYRKQRLNKSFKPNWMPNNPEFIMITVCMMIARNIKRRYLSIRLTKDNIKEWKHELKRLSRRTVLGDLSETVSDQDWLDDYLGETVHEVINDNFDAL